MHLCWLGTWLRGENTAKHSILCFYWVKALLVEPVGPQRASSCSAIQPHRFPAVGCMKRCSQTWKVTASKSVEGVTRFMNYSPWWLRGRMRWEEHTGDIPWYSRCTEANSVWSLQRQALNLVCAKSKARPQGIKDCSGKRL